MEDIIVILIVAVIVILAGVYIYKAKKSGKKCIGCPDGCSCSKNKMKNDNESSCCCCCDSQQDNNCGQ